MSDTTIWNSDDAAKACNVTRRQFMEHIRYGEGFPAALPISGMRPVWSAKAIQEWLEKSSRRVAA